MSLSLNLGSAKTSCNSLFKRVRIFSGKFAGATRPYQVAMSYPDNPDSAIVGTLGAAAERLAVVTPSARRFPAFTCGHPLGKLGKLISTCPEITSGIALPVPLYGI